MKTTMKKVRTAGICLITAAAIAAPGLGHAGLFGSAKKAAQTIGNAAGSAKPGKKIAKAVKSGAEGVQDTIGDIASKLDELYAQIEDNRPLLNALKDGQMVQQLTEVVEFLNQSQRDFQQFAESGVYTLRDDVKELAGTVSDIGNMLNLDGKLSEQLQNSADLVDRIPATFLFVLAKSGIDKRLQDIVARLIQLRDDLVLIVTLPPEQEVFLYPEMFHSSLCPLVSDPATKTQLAVLKARINYNVWTIDTISGLIPEDLTINVTVVGGGGATVAKFPLQYVFKGIKTILDLVKMRLETYESIAGSMECDTV